MNKQKQKIESFSGDLIFGLVGVIYILFIIICRAAFPMPLAMILSCFLLPITLVAYLRSTAVISQLVVSCNHRRTKKTSYWSIFLSLGLLLVPIIYVCILLSKLDLQIIVALGVSWLIAASVTFIKNLKSSRPAPINFLAIIIINLGVFCLLTPLTQAYLA